MVSSIKIGLSGLIAASSRMEVAASNIANAGSTTTRQGFTEALSNIDGNRAYVPKRAQSQPLPGGGVQTTVVDSPDPYTAVYAPHSPEAGADGQVNYPNVSLAEEVVNLIQAEHAYKANALVIKTAVEVQKKLLDETDV